MHFSAQTLGNSKIMSAMRVHFSLVELILDYRWQVELSDFTACLLNKDVYTSNFSPSCVQSCYTEQSFERKTGSTLKCCLIALPVAERLALCHSLSATMVSIEKLSETLTD